MTETIHKFPSYALFIQIGKDATKTIRSIRAGGYRAARRYMSFYSRARWQDSQARKAVAAVKKIGNPKPYFFQNHTLYVLDLHNSLNAKTPRYYPARGFSPKA